MRDIDGLLEALGVMPVIKLDNPERDAAPLAQALCSGGIPGAEVTFRAAGADTAIRRMRDCHPEMLIGAGTVLTLEQVDRAVSAGAEFIVTPGFDPDIVAYCVNHKIPVYPGCTTPTDYHAALKYGLKILKFFPAEQSGGLDKIKAMSAPFPMFRIMPTGGITLSNLEQYLTCPIVIACGGSYMASGKLIDGQKWDEIQALCKQTVEIVYRSKKLR